MKLTFKCPTTGQTVIYENAKVIHLMVNIDPFLDIQFNGVNCTACNDVHGLDEL